MNFHKPYGRAARLVAFFCLLIFVGLGGLFAGGSSEPPTTRQAAQTEAPAADVSLSRVVLYSSGVAYFQFDGVVDGNSELELVFEPEDLNDVLKSLVVRDFDGGTVGSVVYPGQDPVERILQSFAVDLSGYPGMAAILQKLRGSRMIAGPERGRGFPVSGALVSVEPYSTPDNPLLYRLVLNTARGLVSVTLENLEYLRLEDPKLSADLEAALAVLAGQSGDRRRPVTIPFNGTGERRVALSYISETPVWKTSYRIDLGRAAEVKEAVIQAWAIVENTGDTDWTNVQLSLVSGSPVSFIQDLVTPLYNPRPVIASALQKNFSPQAYAAAEQLMAQPPMAAARSGIAAPSAAPMGEVADYNAREEERFRTDSSTLGSGVSAAANAATQVGELFAFDISSPVTIPRRQSGMIPIVSQSIPAEKLSIYTTSDSGPNPMAGVRLTNETGSRLPAGPITVFAGGIYAGDALISSFGPDDERIITYAADLDLRVSSRSESTQTVSRYQLNKGVLQIRRDIVYTRTVDINSTAGEVKTLLLEHPKNSNRTLLGPGDDRSLVAPAETTEGAYRFKVIMNPNSKQTLVIKETQTIWDSITLLNSRNANFLSYTTDSAMSPQVRAVLQRAAELWEEGNVIQTRINDNARLRSTAANDQARVRENVVAVGRDSAQGRVFLERMLALENQILEIDAQTERDRVALENARKRFNDYLEGQVIQ